MNRTTARIAAVLAVLVCGACAPRPGTARHPADALTASAVDLVTDSGAAPARRHLTEAAEEQVTQRCMAEAGQPYRPYVVPMPAGDDEHRLVDLAGRRAHGYGIGQPAAPPTATARERTAEFHRALFGVATSDQNLKLPNDTVVSFPATGCIARGRAELFGDVQRWARVDSIPQVLGNALRATIHDDLEVGAATGRWSACMRSAGFRYANPSAARNAAQRAYTTVDGARARRDELAIAVADGTCDLAVHLTGTELALRRTAAASLPGAQRRELNDLAAIDCAAAVRAAQLLGRPGPAAGC